MLFVKFKKLLVFLESDDVALVCTHATLRFAFQEAGEEVFDDCVLAIDEFHHSSSSEESKLGELLRCVLQRDKAHVIAMTGSYFRGDDMAIMSVEDEARFTHVSYTYWEQMAAYKHLKTLKINYSFYSALDGSYLQALPKVFDLSKKTIIHIPHRMSPETAGSKHDEVDAIIDIIGDMQDVEEETNFYPVVTKDGHTLIVNKETDTLGNLLQSHIVNKYIENENESSPIMFCGYKRIHPLEEKIMFTIKMKIF